MRVNAINPRQIDTKRLSDFRTLEPTGYAATIAEIPMGRVGLGPDVMAVVEFLLSEEASYITGQVLHVNGGMWM